MSIIPFYFFGGAGPKRYQPHQFAQVIFPFFVNNAPKSTVEFADGEILLRMIVLEFPVMGFEKDVDDIFKPNAASLLKLCIFLVVVAVVQTRVLPIRESNIYSNSRQERLTAEFVASMMEARLYGGAELSQVTAELPGR
jgi:hypothetical protein